MRLTQFLRARAFRRHLVEAVYPVTCEVCGKPLIDGEEIMCLSCMIAMPRTYYHRLDTSDIHLRLADPAVPVERTASWFHYVRENPYALMVQQAKYANRPELARALGRIAATELKTDRFFDGIDILLPVPLHWSKRATRGYNQSEEICIGINEATGIPISDNLTVRRHSTQTRLGAEARFRNLVDTISVHHPEELQGRHLLVVDDVITSGATMRTALAALHEAVPDARLSVMSIGAAHRN